MVFDVLRVGSVDFFQYPAFKRARQLEICFPVRNAAVVATVTAYTTDEKIRLWHAAHDNGVEGIVLKENVPYSPGRPNSRGPAIKYKFVKTASVICAGKTDKNSFKMRLLDGTELGSCTIPPNKIMPKLDDICEIRYLYRHNVGGNLIQPVYLGVRDDITPDECTAEQFHVKGVARMVQKTIEKVL